MKWTTCPLLVRLSNVHLTWTSDALAAPKDPNAGPQRGEAGYLDSMPDRAARAGKPSSPVMYYGIAKM